MNGNFVYCNPTKLYFGEDSLDFLNEELPKYGKNVVLVYGAGSIKENGIYDKVINILKKNEKNIAEIAGVMPNPTLAKLYEGIKIARNHNADLLLAVGVGKAVGLVLDGRDKGECPPVHIDGDFPALTVHDGAGAVMVILDHTTDRNLYSQNFQDF